MDNHTKYNFTFKGLKDEITKVKNAETTLTKYLFKVIDAPTDIALEEAKNNFYKYFESFFDYNAPIFKNSMGHMCLDTVEEIKKNLAKIVALMRKHDYHKPWNNDWINDEDFREICCTPIIIPPVSFSVISGIYLLYKLHPDDFLLFTAQENKLKNFYGTDSKEVIKSYFRTFKKNIRSRIFSKDGWFDCSESAAKLLKRTYAPTKHLFYAYEYCKDISRHDKANLPFVIFSNDSLYINYELSDLTVAQKMLLFFQTIVFIELDEKCKLMSKPLNWAIENYLQSLLFNEQQMRKLVNDIFTQIPKKALATGNIAPLVYCKIYLKQRLYHIEKSYEAINNSIPNDLSSYTLFGPKIFQPIGWTSEIGEYMPSNSDNAQLYDKCTWKSFYKTNNPMLYDFFPDLNPDKLQELWDIAKRILVYVYPDRINANEVLSLHKPLSEKWLLEHHFYSEFRLSELMPVMVMCNALRDEKGALFRIPEFPPAQTGETFYSFIKMIHKYNYPPFINRLRALWNYTNARLLEKKGALGLNRALKQSKKQI